MTYTFKLSNRLAVMWSAGAVLGLLAACTDGDMSSVSPFDQLGNGSTVAASGGTISPKGAVAETSQPVKFTSSDDVTWTTSGGTISANGTFSASSSGTFTVVGHGKTKTDTATVTVKGNQPRRLSISPLAVDVMAGQAIQFSSTATLPNGTPTTLDVSWSATGGGIDKSGNYIAGTVPGSYTVIVSAASAGVADTAVVNLTSSAHIVRMFLAPLTASLLTGDVKKYAATAEYDDGTIGPVPAAYSKSGVGSLRSCDTYGCTFSADSTPGTYQMTATSRDGSNLAATATGSVTSPLASTGTTLQSPTTSAGGPNEPAGYSPIAELRPPATTPFSTSIVRFGCDSGGLIGCWWRYGVGESIKTDLLAPMGSNVLELSFPAGLQPGHGEDMFGGWAHASTPPQYRELYESGWFKLPGADFETQLVGVKLWGYWGVGTPVGDYNQVQLYMIMAGNGHDTAIMSSWNIWFGQQGADSRRLDQNLNRSTMIHAGMWHHYELQMVLNDIGVRNGKLNVWLDGVQVLSYQDVKFRDEANPTGFFGRKWHPVWGGGGGTAKTRTDHLWVNEVYISGIPM